MMDKFMPEILRQAPFGYAYHKMVFDVNNLPVDYVFLDINPAFEDMTGLKKERILGKSVTEVLPGIRSSNFDWVAFYGKVALSGEKQEFTQYAEQLERWYKITAISPQTGYFITIIQELTEGVQQIKRLEAQRRQIKELASELETVFNATQDAMFLIQVEGDTFRYIRNNTTHQKLTGFSVEAIQGKTPLELLGPEYGRDIQDNCQRCVITKTPITYEEKLALPAGEKIWLTSLTPVIKTGNVKYLVGSRKDITLQRQAEAVRDDLLQRLQAQFSGHNAVMLLVEPLTGKIVDVNPAACAFYGYTREEILNLHIQDINILSRAEVKELSLKALQEKQTYFIFPHRLKNGEIKLVDVYSCPIKHGDQPLLFSIIFDVTDRERFKEELSREKEFLRTTLHSIGDGVVTTDRVGRITSLNKAGEEITGWSEKAAKGVLFSQIFVLINKYTRERIDPVATVLQTEKNAYLDNNMILIGKDGRQVSIADSAAPIKDDQEQILGAVMVFRDVTKENEQREKILYMSCRDSLTGLYNRRFMEEKLKWVNNERELPLTVIMGDVNGLKFTNDVFGHAAGDELLRRAAEALRESCRDEDIIARWGGDEFLILLPRASAKTAERIIERIKSNCLNKSGEGVQLSIALGCAAKTKTSEDFGQILKEAEEWMYHTKLLEGRSYRSAIISTLLVMLHEKSMETKQHAERLKYHCLQMGRKLKLPARELENLALLAMLHDIGKVGVNENILQKPEGLTAEEWEDIKKHPAIGYRIAQNTPELTRIAEYILAHHERWDGNGYPRGLKGEEVPLLCRILAVADAYDAMTHDRVYRKAMNSSAALAEIKQNAHTQFDPRIVEIFLSEEYELNSTLKMGSDIICSL